MGCSRSQITLLMILGLSACGPVAMPSGPPGGVGSAEIACPAPARTARDAPALVALMNAERARAGLQPLTLSAPVSAVAQAHACDAAARQDIGHIGRDGSTLSERLQRGGITAALVAENNASFYRTPAEAMAAWMASPPHRANILRPAVRRVGVGEADGAAAVWVVDFTS